MTLEGRKWGVTNETLIDLTKQAYGSEEEPVTSAGQRKRKQENRKKSDITPEET